MMAWQGIEGHDRLVEQFRQSLARGRLASTFLFVGPQGVGKRTFALRLAQSLLCRTRPAEALDPCGACAACQQVLAQTHPDLLLVAKPADKSTIPLELLIGSGDKRMREGLCHAIALKSFMGGRKVAIIDDADDLNVEGANCLLKTLEEPPENSLIILIGTSVEKQLPTIRSRAQVIHFRPLATQVVADLLLARQLVAQRAEAERLARFSEGSLARAVELADPELWDFRRQLLAALGAPQLDSVRFGKTLGAFVERAGREAAQRRQRCRQVIGFAIEFYRQLLRAGAGLPRGDDPELAAAIDELGRRGAIDVDTAAAGLERSLEALAHIDRNVNQSTALECGLDDLASLASRANRTQPAPLRTARP